MSANAYALTQEVSPILQRHMRGYSGPGGDKIAAARRDVDEVKGIMVQNIGIDLSLLYLQ